MEKAGVFQMPSMELLVEAYLHPWQSATSSSSPTLPSKADYFQSALNENTYNSIVLSVLSASDSPSNRNWSSGMSGLATEILYSTCLHPSGKVRRAWHSARKKKKRET